MMNNLGKIIENFNLFPRSSKLLVAVSGGMDSMVLAHVLICMKFNIGLVHVNYRLRGRESDLDAELVGNFAKQYGLPFYLSRQQRIIAKSNLQEKARNIRYSYFEKIRNTYKYDFILTAHHEEDVLESFFYNLTRGAGLKGLKSISQVNGYYVRPLLHVNKTIIRAYAQQHQVPFRDDQSNFTSVYDRNFIRNEILPKFEQQFPAFKKMAARSIDHLKSVYSFFNTAYIEWTKKHVTEFHNELHIDVSTESDKVYISQLLSDLHFHPSTIDQILKSLQKTGSQFKTRAGGILVVDRKKLVYILQNQPVVYLKNIQEKTRSLKILYGTFYMHVEPLSNAPHPKSNANQNSAMFDYNSLKFPLTVRNWKPGDRVNPLGLMGKSKKVQDLFTDSKIHIFEKAKIPLVCSGDHIIWIPGLLRSNHCLVTKHTVSVFTMVWTAGNPDLL